MDHSHHLARLEQNLPEIIQTEQLATLIGKSAETIRHAATNKGRQHLIPRPFKLPNSRRLLWYRADVLAWLAQAKPAFVGQKRRIAPGAPPDKRGVSMTTLELVFRRANGAVLVPQKKAAQILGIPYGTIRNKLSLGTFPLSPVRIGRLVFFRADDIAREIDLSQKGGA